ncbi:MAG: peptidylprolyl isomerase [Myxococcaceae bacterium]|nr:peptidylprolyl isomerase [Myxococcaceae bacterium]
MSPMAEALTPKDIPLPKAKAPSLEGLEVTVPAPDDLTAEDLARRFHEKTRSAGTSRDRAEGEALAAGDDVLLNLIGYVDGKLMPFSTRFRWWTELAPMPALPGLMEAVAAGEVGDSLEVMVTLPATYPAEPFRGAPVRFAVDVLAAREVKPLDPSAKDFFPKLGLGDSMDAVMDTIREELEEELADELVVLGRELVLDELARRSGVEVPSALVDEEVRRRWMRAELPLLVEHGFTVEEQNEARDAWLRDGATRAECERRLKIGLAVAAMIDAEKLAPTPEELKETLEIYGEPWGLTPADIEKAAKESKKSATGLGQLALYLYAVDYAVTKAKLHFEGA